MTSSTATSQFVSTNEYFDKLKKPRYTLWAEKDGKRRRISFTYDVTRDRANAILAEMGYEKVNDYE